MSVITCLDDYITLRGTCDDTTPISGIYINDLPGIELKMLSSLSNEEQASYKGVWEEIYRRSVNELEADVTSRMARFFKKSLILQNQVIGFYQTPAVTESASAFYKGATIEVYGSNYLSVFINQVELYLNSAGSVNVRVYDFRTGQLLDSLTFTGSVGHNVFQVDKNYTSFGQRRQLFVCYNATSVSSQETGTFSPEDNSNEIATVRGAIVSTASSVVSSNMAFEGKTYGLLVNYNLQCSVGQFICSIRDTLKLALWYKLGEQICLERQMSMRFNQYTLFNADRAKELRDEYIAKYIQVLDTTLNEIEPASDGLCIECEKQRTYKYQLP